MKITSPDTTYTGQSRYGDTVLNFEKGVAVHDGDLPAGVRQYLNGAGYGLDGAPSERSADPEPADPRDVTLTTSGTPLRDAAVDPRPGDFLAPVNAGQANPHGPQVVSPEVHASEGVRPIKGGDVHVDDPAVQDDAEKAHLSKALAGDLSADGPEGAPSEEWTVAQLKDYADSNGVDLGGATKKADILAALK